MSIYDNKLNEIEGNIMSIINEFDLLIGSHLPNATVLLNKLTEEVNKLDIIRSKINDDEYDDYERQEHMYQLYKIKEYKKLLL